MKTIKFREWELIVDNEATKKTYDNISGGTADGCTCNGCKNYVNIREEIFPGEIKTLFSELSIDYTKECENTHFGKVKSGRHLYSSWFHFKGQFKNVNTSELSSTQINNNFSLGFKYDRGSTFFENMENLVQVEVYFEIPWTIEKELETE